MWCAILNGAILLAWTLMWTLAPDLLYGLQRTWFPLSRETYTVVMYAFVGFYKILILTFNVIPFIALLIVGRKAPQPNQDLR
jgi:hypothetical protein